MKRFVKLLLVVLLMVCTAAVTFTITWVELGDRQAAAREEDPVGAKLQEIQALLDTYYIDEYDEETVYAAAADGAAAAMVEATGDYWSYYISADEMQAHEESLYNTYVGIGVTIEVVDEGMKVVQVTEGGPAYDEDVRVGDIIIEAEDQKTAELGLDATRALIRGESGTQVRLVFLRDGQRLEKTLTRAAIVTPVAVCELLEGNIGYITIANFDYHCAEQTLACMDTMLEQGAQALLFDVRFNPGGLKDEMILVLDELLPEGDVFRSVNYAGRETVDTSDSDCLELPMAVLVNEDSYSAAEFFAAALQEYGVADVVGTQTFGKGNFQYTLDLSDGSAVTISAGKYFTPQGKSLTGVGITPDVVVELSDEAYEALYYGTLAPEDDPQLEAALETLRQKIS